MILIENASATDQIFEQMVLMAEMLHASGIDARLSAADQPGDLPSPLRFDAARYMVEADQETFDGLILLNCHKLSQDRMNALQQIALTEAAAVLAIGAFENTGHQTSATAQMSYAIGKVPLTINLIDHPQIHAPGSAIPCFGLAVEPMAWRPLNGATAVQVFAPEIETVRSGLQVATTNRNFATLIYTSSKEKAGWLKQFGPGAHIMSYGEVSPLTLASMGHILVMTGPVKGNYRALIYLNAHLASGSVVIDATPDGALAAEGLDVLRGPADLAYLNTFLRETILPNIDEIRAERRRAATALQIAPRVLLSETDLHSSTPPAPGRTLPQDAPDTWFMPTNGHGLGHAQRCTLVAEALRDADIQTGFLAFPSCLNMIRERGFDAIPLVSRSSHHKHSTANDEANYARLNATFSPGQTLVFDGGFVFNSITKTILENNLNAVWIRRGLWTAAQDNTIPLDRERYFCRVIVPQEALDALNRPVTSSTSVREIGPVVRLLSPEFDSDALRAALAEKFGAFDELIVTMLGSGVYLDISTQLQMVSAFAEGREGCLNLVVVWPGAMTPAARFSWERSRVVSTRNATQLAAAADVVVSAAGYNSFHETLYNKVPTIFVPQTAEWLDDQTARAELAAERGLAACVPPERPGRVTRELGLFLGRGKAEEIRANLSALTLPEPGTAAAARLIAEVRQ